MSVELTALFMFGTMLALMVTGRQIFFIVGGVATLSTILLWGGGGIDIVFFSTFKIVNWHTLLAIPLFIFMGLTLARSGVADNLYHSMYLWMGRVNGGLAMGTIGICALVAAMSGLNIAATVTACTIGLPSMLKRKYNKTMVTGVVLAGGALGFLIPPSVVFVIFGLIARVSAGHLWVAGVFPGILLATMYILYIGIRCKINPSLGPAIPAEQRVGWGEKFRSLKSGILPIILIFLVIGLLIMGVTTLTECAAIGAAGSLVCAAVNRRLTMQVIKEVMDEALKVTVLMFWIFIASMLFGAVFDRLGAVYGVEKILRLAGGGPWGAMIMMQLSFFVLGTMLDDTALLLIVAPLYIPVVSQLGFSLVWFGVLYVINMQMAFITPPFGYNLFIFRGIAPKEITMVDIYRSIIPFVGIQAVCLGIVMAFPQIALWLPSIVFPA